jgi:hypothetical protein
MVLIAQPWDGELFYVKHKAICLRVHASKQKGNERIADLGK